MTSKMFELLAAEVPDVEVAPEFQRFSRFVGSWEIDAEFWDDYGTTSRTSAEWHFAPILGGRALQDVLVFPALKGAALGASHRVGTSVRFYDAEAGLWRVVWINPATGTMYKLAGGKEGDRIVLVGDPNDGEPTQWIFEDITDTSFTWRGIGATNGDWRLIQLMKAQRI